MSDDQRPPADSVPTLPESERSGAIPDSRKSKTPAKRRSSRSGLKGQNGAPTSEVRLDDLRDSVPDLTVSHGSAPDWTTRTQAFADAVEAAREAGHDDADESPILAQPIINVGETIPSVRPIAPTLLGSEESSSFPAASSNARYVHANVATAAATPAELCFMARRFGPKAEKAGSGEHHQNGRPLGRAVGCT